MKYFFDTEFIDGFHKPLFGKKRHFIDLISIAIVAEDGREFYAISNEYNYKDADKWVQDNVILPMYIDTVHGDMRNKCDASNFHRIFGQSNKSIVHDLLAFFGCWRDIHFWRAGNDTPEFYGYYADYDWVLFCSLFGRMIDLPKGFPMYCRDLKHMLDEFINGRKTGFDWWKNNQYERMPINLEEGLKMIKGHPDYPKQTNQHNALADAKWNYKLFKFLESGKI